MYTAERLKLMTVIMAMCLQGAWSTFHLIPRNITLLGEVRSTLSTTSLGDCLKLEQDDTVAFRYDRVSCKCFEYTSVTGYTIAESPKNVQTTSSATETSPATTETPTTTKPTTTTLKPTSTSTTTTTTTPTTTSTTTRTTTPKPTSTSTTTSTTTPAPTTTSSCTDDWKLTTKMANGDAPFLCSVKPTLNGLYYAACKQVLNNSTMTLSDKKTKCCKYTKGKISDSTAIYFTASCTGGSTKTLSYLCSCDI